MLQYPCYEHHPNVLDKPSGNAKGSDFVLTVVNPQSITYTNIAFDIRVYGRTPTEIRTLIKTL